jgi:5-methylcytosine-specific restriction endonuclease McrA
MRICSGPGCGRAVPDNVRFCVECKADSKPEQTRVDRARTDPIMLEYGTKRWHTVRRLGLQKQPFCKGWSCECNEVAKVGDHHIPARLVVKVSRALGLFPYEKWPGFYILDNVAGLCHSCHTKKTKVEDAQDWTEQLVALLSRFVVNKEITEDAAREKIIKAYAL